MFASFTRITSTFLLLATSANAALNFTGAAWIWSSEAAGPVTPIHVPVAHRAFRKDFPTGLLKLPTSIEVIITADDQYTLYVGGNAVGSGNNWRTTKYFCVRTNPIDIETIFGKRVVIAVDAANTQAQTPAGVIASVKINYLDGGSDQFVTDASWVSNMTVGTGFQDVNVDDSSWSPSIVEEIYGGKHWGKPPAPTNQTCSS